MEIVSWGILSPYQVDGQKEMGETKVEQQVRGMMKGQNERTRPE